MTPRAPRHLLLRLPASTRIRVERRSILAAACVGTVLLIGMVTAVLIGDYPLSVGQAVRSLLGIEADPLARFFVQEQRAPRMIAAVIVGAALGMSGCIFQSLSANPLGSPDVIGFTTGAATGALIAIILLDAGPASIAFGAVLGGLLTAAAVYALSWRRRQITGSRLVLVGIGVAAMLQAVNALLVVRADLTSAQTAAIWLAGSLNATSWAAIAPYAALIGVSVAAAVLLTRPLTIMTAGDEVAAGVGVAVERRRRQLVAVGVMLVAGAVAIAGPVAFVALAAPHIARRLTRTGGVAMGTSALVGAVIMVASDIVAQRLVAPTQLPVGVVTGTVGGVFLIWLLTQEWKKS